MQQPDDIINGLRQEVQAAREDVSVVMEVNVAIRKEITMLEKLLKLNMHDLWDIADQRDWYYEEYRKLKELKGYTK